MNETIQQDPQDEQAALPPPAPAHPKAFDAGQWASIPEDLKDEALERASWIAFRGTAAEQALDLALQGMREDLAKVETEPSWWAVRAIASHWPAMRRMPSGHYRTAIMHLASAIEAAAWAEACERGSVPDPLALVMGLLPEPQFAPVAVAVFDSRVEAYTLPPPEEALPGPEGDEGNSGNTEDYPYEDPEGFQD